MKKLIVLLALTITAVHLHGQDYYLLTGTYTSGKSKGIYVHSFDTRTLGAKELSVTPLPNPSFLAVAPGGDMVYAVSENAADDNGGSIHAFRFDSRTGFLTPLNSKPSGGDHPCYVTASNELVIAGNYSSGTAVVYKRQKDGNLGERITLVKHSGKSVNSSRQEKPHVHACYLSPEGKTLYVPDLGTDKVVTYKVDEAGNLNDGAVADLSVKPGSGPRHIDLHPNGRFAYVIMELTGEVAACIRDKNGSLKIIQTLPSTAPSFKGFAGSADIHVSPDGRFLYASNRGDANDIAIFSIDQKTGRLSHLGNQSVLGKAPRNFSIDPTGRLLLAANQNSDEVVIFSIDPATGALTDTGKRISIPNPVCLKWIKR